MTKTIRDFAFQKLRFGFENYAFFIHFFARQINSWTDSGRVKHYKWSSDPTLTQSCFSLMSKLKKLKVHSLIMLLWNSDLKTNAKAKWIEKEKIVVQKKILSISNFSYCKQVSNMSNFNAKLMYFNIIASWEFNDVIIAAGVMHCNIYLFCVSHCCTWFSFTCKQIEINHCFPLFVSERHYCT